jgi:hypothetical protein
MNCKQLYEHIRHRFAREDVKFSYFVNPTLNHKNFPSVQFTYSSGAIKPPWNHHADDIHIANPLAGPFYTLPLAGLCFIKEKGDGWHRVRAIVEVPATKVPVSSSFLQKTLSASTSILIRGDENHIRKELELVVGNRWYDINDLGSPVPSDGELV